jgi:hypothetical protein
MTGQPARPLRSIVNGQSITFGDHTGLYWHVRVRPGPRPGLTTVWAWRVLRRRVERSDTPVWLIKRGRER